MRRFFSLVLLAAFVITVSCSSPTSGKSTVTNPSTAAQIDATDGLTPSNLSSLTLGPQFSYGAGVLQSVTFRYWNPAVTQVSVALYDHYSDPLKSPVATVAMTEGTGSIWTVTVPAPVGHPYYDYSTSSGVVLDPYAPSMAEWVHNNTANISGDNLGKGALVDLTKLTPDGGLWANYGTSGTPYFDGSGLSGGAYQYASAKDAIIYEASIRDLTNDPTFAFATGHQWGTFKALVDILPHIQKLGVTHVQLQCPLENFNYDQTKVGVFEGSLSEQGGANYNWGYDPQSYFTPSGMYSSHPGDPASRVTEFMTLVNEIHKAGMGVLVDVVFNHTANNTILGNGTLPDYYYRSTSDNGAGSNDVRSETKMTRKLILDAIMNLVSNYKVDGFRFDLMGVLDTGTVNAAYTAATAVNPRTLFVGEGWTGYYSGYSTDYTGASVAGADQNHVTAFNGKNIAMFSDSFRNVFKNGYPSDGSPAFITGSGQYSSVLRKNIFGVPTNTNDNFNAASTNNVVSYLTCHDNYCLHDVISVAMGESNETDILSRAKLAFGAMLTSQGVGFIYGGDEILRTKKASDGTYNSNSYNASDAINQVNWLNCYGADPIAGGFTNYNTASTGYQLYHYAQGLTDLRKSTNAFRLPDGNTANLSWFTGTGTTLNYGFKAVSTDNTGTYYVFMNAGKSAVTIASPDDLTGATLLVDGSGSGTKAIANPTGVSVSGTSVTVQPLTFAVLKL